MTKKILLALILAGLPPVFAADGDTLELAPGHPTQYTVVRGDTLWDIAGQFLREPWRWKELWEANPQVQNPDLIYPGDVLSLTYKDGRPLLGLRRSRDVKLSPQVRESGHEDAIKPIPLDHIYQFLSEPRVTGPGELEAAPYVVSSREAHLVNGPEGRIYVRGLTEGGATKFSVYRGGVTYRDPDAGDAIIGYEALHVADAVVERFGDPATLRITRATREVLNGDRLLPHDESSTTDFIPRGPEQTVAGRIIAVVDGVSQIGQYQVVVLSLGSNDGIAPGHVLGVFQTGEPVRDTVQADQARMADASDTGAARVAWQEEILTDVPANVRDTKRMLAASYSDRPKSVGELVALPEERAGEVMVFRTFADVSYGLVMRITRPVHIHDRVRNP